MPDGSRLLEKRAPGWKSEAPSRNRGRCRPDLSTCDASAHDGGVAAPETRCPQRAEGRGARDRELSRTRCSPCAARAAPTRSSVATASCRERGLPATVERSGSLCRAATGGLRPRDKLEANRLPRRPASPCSHRSAEEVGFPAPRQGRCGGVGAGCLSLHADEPRGTEARRDSRACFGYETVSSSATRAPRHARCSPRGHHGESSTGERDAAVIVVTKVPRSPRRQRSTSPCACDDPSGGRLAR